MNTLDLFSAVTALPDDLVDGAAQRPLHKAPAWRRYAALAAALALVVGLAGVATGRIRIPGLGANAGPGGSRSDGLTYMSYAGPVFPLTAEGDASGITAERDLTFDFSPYETHRETYADDRGEAHEYERWRSEARVTDAYTLTNGTDADRTLTLLYPAALSLAELAQRAPAITVDGAPVETEWRAGDFAGGFAPAWGSKNTTETLNLDGPNTWETYRALLSDGSYFRDALTPPESALDLPVTVYRVDPFAVETAGASNPSLLFSFTYDPARTRALTVNSNITHTQQEENGLLRRGCGFSGLTYENVGPMYVALVGEDIDGYTLQGYADGGCDRGEEIDVTAEVTRSASTLGELLRLALRERADADASSAGETARRAALSDEESLLFAADYLLRYGALADTPMGRYETGALEDSFEALSVGRVIWFAFDVTIPAHAAVRVSADLLKPASQNFPDGGRDAHTHGYDLVTTLGSTLTFRAQRVALAGTEHVTVTGGNLGLDPAAGVTSASLDLTQEHYWLQIQKKTAKN